MYKKTSWKARHGTGLNKFTETERSGNTVVLTNTPDSISEPGTPFSVDNMNNIEDGIYRAHNDIASEVQERQLAISTATQALQREIETLHNGIAQIISLMELNSGPIPRFPLITAEDGAYLVTAEDGDYLVVA